MCRIRDRTKFESELLIRASAGPTFIYWKYVVIVLVSLSVNRVSFDGSQIVDRIFRVASNREISSKRYSKQDNVYEKISFFFN